jgi:hypothetical protein
MLMICVVVMDDAETEKGKECERRRASFSQLNK